MGTGGVGGGGGGGASRGSDIRRGVGQREEVWEMRWGGGREIDGRACARGDGWGWGVGGGGRSGRREAVDSRARCLVMGAPVGGDYTRCSGVA